MICNKELLQSFGVCRPRIRVCVKAIHRWYSRLRLSGVRGHPGRHCYVLNNKNQCSIKQMYNQQIRFDHYSNYAYVIIINSLGYVHTLKHVACSMVLVEDN